MQHPHFPRPRTPIDTHRHENSSLETLLDNNQSCRWKFLFSFNIYTSVWLGAYGCVPIDRIFFPNIHWSAGYLSGSGWGAFRILPFLHLQPAPANHRQLQPAYISRRGILSLINRGATEFSQMRQQASYLEWSPTIFDRAQISNKLPPPGRTQTPSWLSPKLWTASPWISQSGKSNGTRTCLFHFLILNHWRSGATTILLVSYTFLCTTSEESLWSLKASSKVITFASSIRSCMDVSRFIIAI